MASIQFKAGKSGKKTYYVVISVGGKHKWLKAGNLTDARKLRRQIESLEKTQLQDKLGLSPRQIRLDSFFQEFADHTRLHNSPATVKRYLVILNTFIVFLRMFYPRMKYLGQIKQEHIEAYQRQRLTSIELKKEADGDRVGVHKNKKLPLPQTVNYELKVLRTAFIWARNLEYISNVPTKSVKSLKPKGRTVGIVLSPDECQSFLQAAEQLSRENQRLLVYYRAFKFLLNTGLRSGELCHLTWDDVDLETGIIKIQAKTDWSPKTYERQFYMNEVCLRLLKKMRPGSGYIFIDVNGKPLNTDYLRRTLLKVAQAAGLEGFTRVHDLRHTFNSLMQMRGVDPGTMATILGHKDISTTQVYTHQTQEHLKKSINRIGLK